MSWQLSVWSFFTKPNTCYVVDKQGGKKGTDAEENEGQAINTDKVYQPAAANNHVHQNDRQWESLPQILQEINNQHNCWIVELLPERFEDTE